MPPPKIASGREPIAPTAVYSRLGVIMSSTDTSAEKAKTGIWGLDDILSGGFSRGHRFPAGRRARAPARPRSPCSSCWRAPKPARNASTSPCRRPSASCARRGVAWLDARRQIEVFELLPPESLLDAEQQQSLLYSSDLELGETTKQIFDAVERVKPSRVVLDSLSEIRLLAQSSLRYRRQILAIKHYFAQTRRDRAAARRPDRRGGRQDRAQRRARRDPARGAGAGLRRGAAPHCASSNIAASKFRGGYHDFIITTGGVNVFPRLVAAEHAPASSAATLSSGIAELDQLLGGGIDAGSSTLILGPAGTGKSLIAIIFVVAAIARGEKAALFIFDEELGLLFARMKASASTSKACSDGGNLHHRAGRRRRAVARRIRPSRPQARRRGRRSRPW